MNRNSRGPAVTGARQIGRSAAIPGRVPGSGATTRGHLLRADDGKGDDAKKHDVDEHKDDEERGILGAMDELAGSSSSSQL